MFILLSSAALAGRTYVVYEGSDKNEYIIPHSTGKSEVCVVREKANKLNPLFFEIDERNEEKERLFNKKFRGFRSWVNNKFYEGYHEDVFGSKRLYLNWHDVDSKEYNEDFHHTIGYHEYKGKTYSERLEKYSNR